MTLSWADIARLGLVQMALGSIVVLTTSTLNRLMVVELGLLALIPGALVALHYGIQLSRPHWGFQSDQSHRRTRWIILGMFILALGGFGAALSVVLMEQSFWSGLALAVVAYSMIGLGVGAAGTSLLALLAKATAPRRRAAAATITWLMMIFGIAMTAGVVGSLLDPYSPSRLLVVAGSTVTAITLLAALAVWGIEARVTILERPKEHAGFFESLREVWQETEARQFTIFVFLSMSAYFMQELILEPYAGLVFAFTPGESTSLSGAQNGGVFLGMLTVGVLATALGIGNLRAWVIAGCLGSAGALAAIVFAGHMQTPLLPPVVALGVFNGMFAVAAIGSMMALAGEGRARREGTRMGLWGAAQAIAAGFGGLMGAALVDVLRGPFEDAPAFGAVFLFEAALFLAAAYMAAQIMRASYAPPAVAVPGE